MTDRPPDEERSSGVAIGVALGIVFGGGAGTVLFALTGSPIWIAIGPGIGLTIGLLIGALTGGDIG